MRWLSHRIFTALGWKFEGEIPAIPKMVIIGAPHTSNWDFFLFLAAIHHFNIEPKFLGKHTLFRWPFGAMFRKVGGIPVDRTRGGGIVAQVKAVFESVREMILVIAPEGTRSPAPSWKSGFLEIAEAAEVPVLMAGVDSARKALVVSPPHEVGPSRSEFMDRVRAFYANKDGLNPEGKGPVRLRSESVS
jgi:1-acyl-sn-glycerol-3-phosphate acyltransferase